MRRWLLRSVLLVIAAVGTSALLRGQAPDQKASPVEVASVKANTSGSLMTSMQINLPDGFTATNQTLGNLIAFVYQVRPWEMSGAPDWLLSSRFDIDVKSDHQISFDEKLGMIRSLLEERFSLQTHHEVRDTRIYALVIASSDRTLGPNLKPTNPDCAAVLQARRIGGPGAMPLARSDTSEPACGAMAGDLRGLTGKGVPMFALANLLSGSMRETVVDRTGLIGFWDLSVSADFAHLSGSTVGGAAPSDTPSIFSALQEQLGLRLEPRVVPLGTFVIDHVERPTPD
jgi:uncharacterized protein (TIGR03435 family)